MPVKRKKIYILLLISFALVCCLFVYKLMSRPVILSYDDDPRQILDQLRSLPYTTWSGDGIDSDPAGVTKYVVGKVFPGYNAYTSDNSAYLLDMNGQVAHSWDFPESGRWQYFEILENGEILALCSERYLIKLDAESEIIWKKYYPVHHYLEILPDKTYLVPMFGLDTGDYNWRPVNFDRLVHLSDSGEIISQWSTFDSLGDLKKLHQPHFLDKSVALAEKLKRLFKKLLGTADKDLSAEKNVLLLKDFIEPGIKYDYYHLNSIEIIPSTALASDFTPFQEGNYLISLRNVSLLVVLDKDTKEILWSWGPGILDWPHTPTMLENGNILIFDNGTHRGYSRVIEVNPVNKNIVWEYKAENPGDFHSKYEGSAQRLPNGNTLICETSKGRVFEITKNGEIVWDFYNPAIEQGKRKTIHRMHRIFGQEKLSFLSRNP